MLVSHQKITREYSDSFKVEGLFCDRFNGNYCSAFCDSNWPKIMAFLKNRSMLNTARGFKSFVHYIIFLAAGGNGLMALLATREM